MMKKILFALLAVLFLYSVSFAADGDIAAVRVSGTGTYCGWVAQIDITDTGNVIQLGTDGTAYAFGMGTNNDPTNAKVTFTVTSPGFDATGTATTIARTVYGTWWLRQLFPNQAKPAETVGSGIFTIQVSLSEFIYSGETSVTVTMASGVFTRNGITSAATTDKAVINNSATVFPKAVGRWAWPQYEQVKTNTYLLEAVIFHKFAQNGKPVAAVKFDCVDEHAHSSATVTVTDMTKSTRSPATTVLNGDANPVLVYAANVDFSSMTNGDKVTCNFKAYPWAGDNTGSILNSDLVANGGIGIAQPDERLGPLEVLCDRTGAYGEAYAVVDLTNGQSVTTWDSGGKVYVYSTQAAAEAAYGGDNTLSVINVGKAAQCIKDFNNDTYTRNEPGGGYILLAAGTHTYPGTSPASTLGTQKTWMTITHLSTVTKANAIFGTGTLASLKTQRLKFYDLDLTYAATSFYFYGVQATDVLWVHNCTINTGAQIHTFYVWNQVYCTQNAVARLADGFLSSGTGASRSPISLIRGNNNSYTTAPYADQYMVIGNKNVAPYHFLETGNAQGQQISENAIIAFNTLFNSALYNIWLAKYTDLTHGFAIVQNLIESVSNTLPIIDGGPYAADASIGNTNNIIIQANTLVGQRENVGYNGYLNGAIYALHQNWGQRGNYYNNVNCKDETYTNFPAKTITGISNANPGQVTTSTAHTYANGSKVYIYNVVGMTEVNGNTYTTTSTGSTTFTIGVDTSGYGVWSSGGTSTGANPAKIGGWPVNYMVGAEDNHFKRSVFPADFYFLGLNTVYAGTSGFVSDKGYYDGGGTGNGNYNILTTSSQKSLIASGKAVLPFDVVGHPRRNDGTGAAGAYEYRGKVAGVDSAYSVAGVVYPTSVGQVQ